MHHATVRATSTMLPFWALLACGGTPAPNPNAPVASAGTSASTGSTASGPQPALTGLPPRAFMPTPGALGSRTITRSHKDSFEACHRSKGGPNATFNSPAAGTPTAGTVEAARALEAACAGVTKLKATSTAFTGSLTDAEQGKEFTFALGAGQCLRLYGSFANSVESATIVIKDSAGALAYDDATDVAPKDGELCATSAEALKITVAVGLGKGTFALVVATR